MEVMWNNFIIIRFRQRSGSNESLTNPAVYGTLKVVIYRTKALKR